jgi:GDP-L-fucose synthase
MLKKKDKVLIAGAHGMVGSALCRCFRSQSYCALLTPTRREVDYVNQESVRLYLQEHKPDVVIVAAAKVGGIWANISYPAEFIYMNLMIACNLIHESHLAGVSRLLYLGSSCIYPRLAPQPIPEEALLTAPLEKTNEAYALAKIAGVKMCEYYRAQYGRSYISAMPTNLYGPKDNYHPENAHVIPALIRRFHEAKLNSSPEVAIWGRGSALREFLYVEDLAKACLHLLQHYDEPMQINVGSEEEISIEQLAHMIAAVVGYQGKITYDPSKPDGTPRKKTDIGRILALGWRPTIPLQEGLKRSYVDFCQKII